MIRLRNEERRLLVVSCIVFLWGVGIADVARGEYWGERGSITEPFRLEAGIDSWFTTGWDQWEIQFSDETGFIRGSSKLEWEDLDANIPVYWIRVGLGRSVFLRARYAGGDVDDGRNTDSDYVSVPEYGPEKYLISRSISKTDGETEYMEADIGLIVYKGSEHEPGLSELAFFGGYSEYNESVRDREGVQTFWMEGEVNEAFVEPEGFNAEYDFNWRGVRVGALGKILLMPTLYATGQIGYMEVLDYSGEGYWPLRTDYAEGGPSFRHELDSGWGVETTLSLTYQPWKHGGVRVGYFSVHWNGDEGTGTTFATRDTYKHEVVNVESSRYGFLVGGFLAF